MQIFIISLTTLLIISTNYVLYNKQVIIPTSFFLCFFQTIIVITEFVTGCQAFRNIMTYVSFCYKEGLSVFFSIVTEMIHQLYTENIVLTLICKHFLFPEMSLSLKLT